MPHVFAGTFLEAFNRLLRENSEGGQAGNRRGMRCTPVDQKGYLTRASWRVNAGLREARKDGNPLQPGSARPRNQDPLECLTAHPPIYEDS